MTKWWIFITFFFVQFESKTVNSAWECVCVCGITRSTGTPYSGCVPMHVMCVWVRKWVTSVTAQLVHKHCTRTRTHFNRVIRRFPKAWSGGCAYAVNIFVHIPIPIPSVRITEKSTESLRTLNRIEHWTTKSEPAMYSRLWCVCVRTMPLFCCDG